MADKPSPKYKSIDDILEALKDHSAEADSKEEHSTQPLDEVALEAEDDTQLPPESHVKTAKQLRAELSQVDSTNEHAADEIDPLDDESTAVQPVEKAVEVDAIEDEADPKVNLDQPDSDADIDAHAEAVLEKDPAVEPDIVEAKPFAPSSPGPFKAHISSEEHQNEAETPPQHSAVFSADDAEESAAEAPSELETKYNISSDSEPKTIAEEPRSTPPAMAYEKNLDDLATESVADPGIPRLTPKAPANPAMGQPMSVPPQQPSQQPSQQQTSFNSRNFDYDLNNQGRGSKFHVLILAIIGLAVIGGSVYFLKTQFSNSGSTVAEASPTPAPVETPVPTPTPLAITRADFKVRVLNGTSTTGLAGTVSTKLQELGYQTERTGNATNSAFTQTYIRVKGNDQALFEQLVQDLADYPAASASALRDTDAADAEVIIGQ